MLGNRRTAHFEMPGNGVDAAVIGDEEIKHAAAGRMADGSKDGLFAIGESDHVVTMRKTMLTRQV